MNIFDLDALLLARMQFAFVVSFHILFPAFTIGLASFLAVIEWRWLRTKNPVYKEIYMLWSKIFAVAFGLGVVSGVVMSYQFGTNWSVFSDKIGSVMGPLLGYEVLTAFFLESSFLGVMLFGWNRVSPRMHFISTCAVAFGTMFSAFWILSANSWMQTPQGFETQADGLFHPTSWIEIVFNPSFPYRFAHMVMAAYLTTAFVIGGIGAWYLWHKKHIPHARIMMGMAALMAVFAAPLQVVIGDLHGLNTLKHQPAKVAAMEGAWETETRAPFHVFALPDQEAETNHYDLKIPGAASLVLTHSLDGEVRGLKSFPKEDRPPVAVVFWSFRIMLAIGFAMVATGIFAAVLYARKKLFDSRLYQLWCMMMTPAGFLAVLAGWFVTEVGRQPWTVYGVLRTADSVSPVLPQHIAFSLVAFFTVYTFVFGFGTYYILRLIGKGPGTRADTFEQHSQVATPFIDPRKEGES